MLLCLRCYTWLIWKFSAWYWIWFWNHCVFENFFRVILEHLPELFCKKGVLKNFANFTEKHLCQSLILIKLQAYACNFIKKRFWNRVKIATSFRIPLVAASESSVFSFNFCSYELLLPICQLKILFMLMMYQYFWNNM